MSDDQPEAAKKSLPDAAKRALAEARKRRAEQPQLGLEKEIDGRKGLDPARYGDWENKGIASDF